MLGYFMRFYLLFSKSSWGWKLSSGSATGNHRVVEGAIRLPVGLEAQRFGAVARGFARARRDLCAAGPCLRNHGARVELHPEPLFAACHVMIEDVARPFAHHWHTALGFRALLDHDGHLERHVATTAVGAPFDNQGSAAQLASCIQHERVFPGQLRADAEIVHPRADAPRGASEGSGSARFRVHEIDANAVEPLEPRRFAQVTRLSAGAQVERTEGELSAMDGERDASCGEDRLLQVASTHEKWHFRIALARIRAGARPGCAEQNQHGLEVGGRRSHRVIPREIRNERGAPAAMWRAGVRARTPSLGSQSEGKLYSSAA